MNCKRTLLTLVITALLLTPVPATGANGRSIEGSWDVTVNLHDPNLPPSFEALETYDRGGGFITSNNMPFLTRVGQGAWDKIGPHQYFVKIRFYKFDPSGLPSGTITVTHTITLNGKDEYTGVGTAVLCELDG
ncbi:MAG TPA: hypothetical protein VLD57_02745, partial [Blastocatellia bacterium]|nr:hypothetical protein [Blastocatellia bacterium]